MWTITGPFDALEKGNISVKKVKLLKTSSRFKLGRRDSHLLVNHGKVSQDHGAFTVGVYSTDEAADPSVVPSLTFFNACKRALYVHRNEAQTVVDPQTTFQLQNNDKIDIVSGVPLIVNWVNLCCFFPNNRGKYAISLGACASLGISVTPVTHPSITHHLLPSYAANASVATSLVLNAQLVKPEWLQEVVRLGNLPANNEPPNGRSLEEALVLPSEVKYRPTFGAALSTSLKAFKVWEPNEERLNMLRGYRFVFVGEKGRETDGQMIEMIKLAGGDWEAFNVEAGHKTFHKTLSKGSARLGKSTTQQKSMIIVANSNAMTLAIGKSEWSQLVQEADSFELQIVTHEDIIQTVLHVDTSYINVKPFTEVEHDRHQSSSPLPDFVPNTHPEELSHPPPTDSSVPTGLSKNLKRRTTPSVASQPPTPPRSLVIEGEDMPPPRKLLKRRANLAPPAIAGIDDPSFAAPAPVIAQANGVPLDIDVLDVNAPIPPRSSRLKRRAGTLALSLANTQIQEATHSEPREEPPLKKFKALFDASHPDRQSTQSFAENAFDDEGLGLTTQTRSQSGAARALSIHEASTPLRAVAEEEEESLNTYTLGRGKKRKSNTQDGTDTDIAEADRDVIAHEDENDIRPSMKKRAIENVNSVGSLPLELDASIPVIKVTSTQKPTSILDAPVGKLDTDVAFLKALASTKKGKKAEDEFDREFNKLKISKPDVQRDEQEKQWAVLDDFLEDRNIRGNFMVVVEMEVYSKNGGRENEEGNMIAARWQGQPNFKKFRKKSAAAARPSVELVVNEEDDFGMGNAYWKGNFQSQSQGDATTQFRSKKPTANTQGTYTGKGKAFAVTHSDSDVDNTVEDKEQSRPTKVSRSRVTNKSQPLFVESDDEENSEIYSAEDNVDEAAKNEDDAATLQSSTLASERPSRLAKPIAGRKTTKKVPIIVDDDSDDGAAFKRFRSRKNGAR